MICVTQYSQTVSPYTIQMTDLTVLLSYIFTLFHALDFFGIASIIEDVIDIRITL